MKWFLIAYITAQALDMTTTAIKLHQGGCQEGNWINAPTAYAVKSGSLGVAIALRGSHPTGVKVVSGIGIASGTYGTIHNLRTSCR